MNQLLENKLKELENAKDYECWYLVKQSTDFDSLCYLVSFLSEYKKDKESISDNLQDYIAKRVSEVNSIKSDLNISSTHRALRVAAFFGLIKMTSTHYDTAIITDTFDEITARCDGNYEKKELYTDIIERQIEKMFISSEIDEEFEGVREEYRLYPVLLLYKILLELGRSTGKYSISIPEYRYLVATTTKFNDCLDTLLLISLLRKEDESVVAEFEKFKDKFDNRMILALKQLDSIEVSNSDIKIKESKIDELARKVYLFEECPEAFNTDDYLDFLGSTCDLFELEKYEHIKIQKNAFNTWMTQEKKENGEPYSELTISSYIKSLEKGYYSFDKYKNYVSAFQLTSSKDIKEYLEYLFNADGWNEFNENTDSKACEYGWKKYLQFVKHQENPTRQTEINEKDRMANGTNILLYGVPGSGKSWTIEHEYCKDDSVVERLVFHPDYTYSDFVGQILPSVDEKGQVSYIFTAGPFTEILRKAYRNPTKEYILVIEEINRGNAPAIFGEIFQLLDRVDEEKDDVKIGTSEYGIINANVAQIVYGDPEHDIKIPSNLSIIATMNTSDQNVFTLDTAFQRRWEMRLIENDFDNVNSELANKEILDTKVTWKEFCVEINNIVVGNSTRIASSEDKRLGAYFVKIGDLGESEISIDWEKYDQLRKKENRDELTPDEKDELYSIREVIKKNRKFPEKVIKYLWDDAFKFNRELVFDVSEYQSLEKVINDFLRAKGNNRFKIFNETVRGLFEVSGGVMGN